MEFILKRKINTSSKEIYSAWLSSEGHTKMTGGEAIITDKIGDHFTAWDGYIEGKNINYEELDDYFRKSPYTCFMSEYNTPFESVMEIKKRSLLDNSNNSKKYALEQLYINK